MAKLCPVRGASRISREAVAQTTIAQRAPSHQSTSASAHQSHVALSTNQPQRGSNGRGSAKPVVTHAGFSGGNIQVPTKRLVHFWSSLRCGAVRPYEARIFLACLEVAEQRKFAPPGCKPVYRLSELATLVGGGGERPIRASLRRLHRAGVLTWRGSDGPRFHDSEDLLADEARPLVSKMEALMPDKRQFFPLPRALSTSVLMGGVKRSVLATVFAHLLRCPHLHKDEGWNPVGTVKANWVEAAFGISERSAVYARTHLIQELGWLSPVASPVWHQKRNGGSFAVNLEWSRETPAQLAEARAAKFSTGESADQNCPNEPVSAELESEQPSPTEISTSALGGKPPQPQSDFFKPKVGQANSAPRLANVVPADLVSVARVMELFDQALVNPRWRERGWTPREDSHLERLNWAAAARRAHVRGSNKPCGVFIHLVSQRKWEHISNEDEDAVRASFSRWATPEAAGAETEQRGGLPQFRSELSSDGAIIRRIESTLRERAPLTPQAEVDGYLKKQGWLIARIEAARASFVNWRRVQDEMVAR